MNSKKSDKIKKKICSFIKNQKEPSEKFLKYIDDNFDKLLIHDEKNNKKFTTHKES